MTDILLDEEGVFVPGADLPCTLAALVGDEREWSGVLEGVPRCSRGSRDGGCRDFAFALRVVDKNRELSAPACSEARLFIRTARVDSPGLG